MRKSYPRLLFCLIRPVGVWLATLRGNLCKQPRRLMGWFGIKGLGSIYYLTYALGKGITGETAEQLTWITFTVVILSIIVHGVTASPLMIKYEKAK